MVFIDPLASALMKRAAQVAASEGRDQAQVGDVLRALLGRPLAPILIEHIVKAASIAEDAGSGTVNDLHMLRAQLSDSMSGTSQLISEHLSDVTALIERLDAVIAASVRGGDV